MIWIGYYCVTKDNKLLWTYGNGRLGEGTYGTYFDYVSEKGSVILTEEEANRLSTHINKLIRYYEPVKSNFSANIRDYSEFYIKVNNKFYERSPVKENGKQPDIAIRDIYTNNSEILNNENSFFLVEKEILDLIEKYHNMYREDAKDYIFCVAECTKYRYDEFQKNQICRILN